MTEEVVSDFGIGSEPTAYDLMELVCDAPHRHGLDCKCALRLLSIGAPTVVGKSPQIQKWAANRLSHKTRFSDSSLYDEVCTVCGARDWVPGVDEIAEHSCTEFQELKHGKKS